MISFAVVGAATRAERQSALTRPDSSHRMGRCQGLRSHPSCSAPLDHQPSGPCSERIAVRLADAAIGRDRAGPGFSLLLRDFGLDQVVVELPNLADIGRTARTIGHVSDEVTWRCDEGSEESLPRVDLKPVGCRAKLREELRSPDRVVRQQCQMSSRSLARFSPRAGSAVETAFIATSAAGRATGSRIGPRRPGGSASMVVATAVSIAQRTACALASLSAPIPRRGGL